MRRYFGTDGIRGRVGTGHITPDFVLKLGWAAGTVLGRGAEGGGLVLIGKDTRISGYMFESALEAGLVAAGVNARLLGPMSTPGVAYLTRAFRASAGIVITASHNPYQDNGIKFFSAHGDKLPDDVEEAIEAALEEPLRTVETAALGKVQRVSDASGRYIEFCKGTVPSAMNFRGLKIVVDCANGATYNTAPFVFEELGATVIRVGTDPDGLNINRDLGSTHPQTLSQVVVAQGGQLGIAFDGDGDRVLMVDASDQVVDGDQLLYVIAKDRLSTGEMHGDVVGTLMSNLGFEHALGRLGLGLVRTQVGDRFIMEHLKRAGGILGGEPSGHIICRDRTSTGDGIVAALQVLCALERLDAGLGELSGEVERYPQVLINVPAQSPRELGNRVPVRDAVRRVEAELAGSGRVLLRPSGTEPLVRVMVEGMDARVVQTLAEELAEVVRQEGRSSAGPAALNGLPASA